MKLLILKLYDWLQAHRGLAGALLVLLLVLCGFSASRLHFEEDISAFLPRNSREQLLSSGGDSKMVVFFRGGGDRERREALYAFQDRWEAAFPEMYRGGASLSRFVP